MKNLLSSLAKLAVKGGRKAAPYVVPIVVAAVTKKAEQLGDKLVTKARR